MDDMQSFYLLKQAILSRYRAEYPYYTGTIQGFGNREIAQLIDLIERDSNARVSEKWAYTHLKPLENNKLPRRDMLDIFARWVGYEGWEEFIYKNAGLPQVIENNEVAKPKPSHNKALVVTGIVLLMAFTTIGASLFVVFKNKDIEVCIKDRYTQKPIDSKQVTLTLLSEGKQEKLTGENGCYRVKLDSNDARIAIQSAYYKADTLIVNGESGRFEFDLQPDDYAMMLRAYMNGNVADWQKRRRQLDEIISEDAVIQEIMFNDIGVEFLDKSEFIAKVTTPVKTMQTLEVVEIEYQDKKIVSLKYVIKKQ